MPIAAALPALMGIGSVIAGGISGASNTRPPSLSPVQQNALNTLLPNLMNGPYGATKTPTIDPIQQALLYGQNAQSLTGANNAVTHALVSRGLGRSGLLGAGLIQNQNQSQANQNNINLGLQQQAIQQRQLNIQDILGLLNVPNIPGQSSAGGFFGGIAPLMAFLGAVNGGNAASSGGGANTSGPYTYGYPSGPYNPNYFPSSGVATPMGTP